MTTRTERKVRKVESWALASGNYVCYGTRCNFPDHTEHFQAVFVSRKEAIKAKRAHSQFYKEYKVVPITITYEI